MRAVKLEDLGEVLVAAAREREEIEPAARMAVARGIAAVPVGGHRPRARGGVDPRAEQPGHRVRGLERGDDALEPAQPTEGGYRLVVGHRDVARAPGVAQVGVLGPRARVVESRGDRMRLEYLAV